MCKEQICIHFFVWCVKRGEKIVQFTTSKKITIVPVQLMSLPINPSLHWHWKSPSVLIQLASTWQLSICSAYSSTYV